jgi:hypothetical protein
LHLIAPFGPFDNEQHIGKARNADLGLPGANSLHKDQIKPSRLNQDRGRGGNMRERSTTAARGDGARESTVVIGVFVDAHAVAEECSTALMRTWVNGEDGNATTTSTRHIGECGGKRTLPRSRRASQAHNKGIARVGRRSGERLLNALIRGRSWTLDCADSLR